MNSPYLESSKQLDRFFPASLHKIKLHIFQNVSKCLIHGLIIFKYKNTCELCNKKQDKDKRREIMAKNFFVLCEYAIDVFHEKFYIHAIENCQFILLVLEILVQWNVGILENIFP